MPTISVIVPSYNHAAFIPTALHSVQMQTNTDWELIVVDDGSTDNTAEIVNSWAAIDKRVRYIFQENQGLSAARNTGIRAATGQYLAFLDADDLWEPEFLAITVRVLQKNVRAAAVNTLHYLVDEKGKRLPQVVKEASSCGNTRIRLLEGGFFPVHSALLRRSALDIVGWFDTVLTSLEDWDLWLRITAEFEMDCIPQPLALYRVSPGSMSTNARRMLDNRLRVLNKHFGPPDGHPEYWPLEKRRGYAGAYRTGAFEFLQAQDPDMAWEQLEHAAAISPDILLRLDTFYELICGEQPRGLRGQTEWLDLAAREVEVQRRLDDLLSDTGPEPSQHRQAYAQFYLALGMLYDVAGQWTDARRCLLQCVRYHPSSLRDTSVLRRMFRLSMGKTFADSLRGMRWRFINLPEG